MIKRLVTKENGTRPLRARRRAPARFVCALGKRVAGSLLDRGRRQYGEEPAQVHARPVAPGDEPVSIDEIRRIGVRDEALLARWRPELAQRQAGALPAESAQRQAVEGRS